MKYLTNSMHNNLIFIHRLNIVGHTWLIRSSQPITNEQLNIWYKSISKDMKELYYG